VGGGQLVTALTPQPTASLSAPLGTPSTIPFTTTFTKAHGAGNDFIVVTDPVTDPAADPETGVGADGLVVVTSGGSIPVVRCFNADGSTASMCGNALRCVAVLLADGREPEFPLFMEGVEHLAVVDGDGQVSVTVTCGPVKPDAVTLEAGGMGLVFDAVHTGTEHLVTLLDDRIGLAEVDVETVGRAVRHHEALAPVGANVSFVQALHGGGLAIRTFERGVEAETLSCASGAVAAVAVAAHRGMPMDGPVTVHNQAASPLTVTPRDVDTFWVGGEVEIVFRGRWAA
jgi:diaminopimelate epimerase